MEKFWKTLSSLMNKTVTGARFLTIIGWLLLWYVITTWLVLGTLSSHQFQQRLTNIVDKQTKKNYSVPALLRLSNQYEKNQIKIKEIKTRIYDLLKRLEQSDRKLTLLKAERTTFPSNFIDLANTLKAEFKDVKTQYANLINQTKEQKENIPPVNTPTTANINNPDKVLQILAEKHEENLKQLDKLITNLEANQKNLAQSEKEISEQLHALLQAVEELEVAEAEEAKMDNDELRDFLVELRYLTKLRFDILATMPAQLLTLILTLSMGSLGSVIFLTRELFREQEKHSINWYIFRPFLGMVTAIAIFVLAKSGQLVISDGGNETNRMYETLNPFFISFLAIISGVLSEQAYEKIHNTGKSFFRAGAGENARWGVHLKKIMESQNKTVAEAAKYLNESIDVIQDWIDEQDQVPEEAQKIIAAWLGKPSREIFSDQSPVSTKKEA
ncbi:MAG TPA: hypothetical protein PK079_00185 [Leptospiraceae bacterium]|nr:hypothetical protein [Leptospiraceae bacterium]HMW05167.1 hypothetical protein [Leptospiraceae bacterium]HMX32512.1 hypothetical protein [Leptospiraceae bacterium]HMY32506.1 hypothetical protein [Leptospiraceae bacterium]HNA05462.1 hypothetical protein [Leptospiraceae bacterium]